MLLTVVVPLLVVLEEEESVWLEEDMEEVLVAVNVSRTTYSIRCQTISVTGQKYAGSRG